MKNFHLLHSLIYKVVFDNSEVYWSFFFFERLSTLNKKRYWPMAEKYERPWSWLLSLWLVNVFCSDAWVTSHNPIGGDYERPKPPVSNWSIFSYAWVTSHDPVGGGLWETVVLSLWLVDIFRCVSHVPRSRWWRIMRDQSLQPLIGQYFQMRESRATTPLVDDYERPWSSASNYNYYATTNYSRPSTPEPVRCENTIVRLWFLYI
jgi:hypothetical protein